MNPEIVKGQVRTWLVFLAGIFGGVGVSRHWFTTEQLSGFVNNETVISIISALALAGWSAWTHRQDNAVAVVATIAADPASPVKAPIVENTIAGRALATNIKNANPEAVVAVAGTDQAERIAKTIT